MAGLEQVGYREATVLDIGCGVGPIHQSMLEQGASEAVGVDLAPGRIALSLSTDGRSNFPEAGLRSFSSDI